MISFFDGYYVLEEINDELIFYFKVKIVYFESTCTTNSFVEISNIFIEILLSMPSIYYLVRKTVNIGSM